MKSKTKVCVYFKIMTSPNVDICVENDDPKANNSNDDEQNESACVLAPMMRQCSQLSDRVKRKSWYNVIYPSYKSRAETFKKLFKEVPENQRLIVGRFEVPSHVHAQTNNDS